MVEFIARVRGSLLGGAVGDALGWPVEFQVLERIRDEYGPEGITELPKHGQVTDDTQMTLFTAEGLIRGRLHETRPPVAALHAAYQRWLRTQYDEAPTAPDGWLAEQPFLYARRAPGNACLSGLEYHREFTPPAALGEPGPVNAHSKGCGTVMRSAPFGLIGLGPEASFELAAQAAQLTHGHPTGYLAAGAFAALTSRVAAGAQLPEAVAATIEQTAAHPSAEETVAALRRAVAIAAEGTPSSESVERVGLGWVAEECLAIAVYAALAGADARQAVILAANHSGDSDSTGAVCGNLVGAAYGEAGLPAEWTSVVEGREVILQVAEDLVATFTTGTRDGLAARYPA
ncbi:Hydrolase [Kitasatospora sp. MMS16-BH015]|uniref:ADP-ribosylglycohydrolase family protein n=1 Tax=Kitasatospora sp. MMS16-BH015 TaxID=2018025 RepID=UPI000CA25841|nr:ADP-ribosylglycohydrolase family protein [Kitasatospora sp. MMS16-BH015]AUG77793.1 Hydrolase [Kitasatospora sp. MMS16-BH015]